MIKSGLVAIKLIKQANRHNAAYCCLGNNKLCLKIHLLLLPNSLGKNVLPWSSEGRLAGEKYLEIKAPTAVC